MELLYLIVLGAVIALLLSVLGFEHTSDLNIGRAPVSDQGCVNYSAAAIPHGTVVAQYTAASETKPWETARKNSVGVIAPTYAYFRLLGILQAPNTKSLAVGHEGRVITGGLCHAKVRVPQSVNLAADTPLVVATSWNASTHRLIFGTSSAGLNPGVLEPLMVGGILHPAPGNPIAILKEALTASGSADTIQSAWVWAIPGRGPCPFTVETDWITTASGSDVFPSYLIGAGEITKVLAVAKTVATNPVTCQVKIGPRLASADQRDALSTAHSIADGDAGEIYGTGADKTGADAAVGGTLGVLQATRADRQFPNQAVLDILIASATTSNVARAIVQGVYY